MFKLIKAAADHTHLDVIFNICYAADSHRRRILACSHDNQAFRSTSRKKSRMSKQTIDRNASLKKSSIVRNKPNARGTAYGDRNPKEDGVLDTEKTYRGFGILRFMVVPGSGGILPAASPPELLLLRGSATEGTDSAANKMPA